MNRIILFGAILAMASPSPLIAQSDDCHEAASTLNRVKEQITPNLAPSVDTGGRRLEAMLRSLETATRLCKDDLPELWFYRQLVGERLATPDGLKSAEYAKRQAAERGFRGAYNPFIPPPSAAPLTPVESVRPIRSKWALVVGINEFQDRSIPTLHYAVKDSTDFADYLRDPKGGRFRADHVFHLVNQEATLEKIREGLGKLRANVGPDDLVVVYISSHGSPRDMDPNGLSYIITADTHPRPSEKLYATSLQMIDLVQQLNREIRARRVVLLLDTCFSGDAQQGAEPAGTGAKGLTKIWDSAPPAGDPSSSAYSEALTNLKIGYGRAVITASRADEKSWESAQLGNGYFTYYLLDVLRKSQGQSPLRDLYGQLRERVTSQVKADRGASQTPTSQFSDQADSIILGVPEAQ